MHYCVSNYEIHYKVFIYVNLKFKRKFKGNYLASIITTLFSISPFFKYWSHFMRTKNLCISSGRCPTFDKWNRKSALCSVGRLVWKRVRNHCIADGEEAARLVGATDCGRGARVVVAQRLGPGDDLALFADTDRVRDAAGTVEDLRRDLVNWCEWKWTD